MPTACQGMQDWDSESAIPSTWEWLSLGPGNPPATLCMEGFWSSGPKSPCLSRAKHAQNKGRHAGHRRRPARELLEDVQLRVLEGRLRLARTQREVAALHCERFTEMLEASLGNNQAKSDSSAAPAEAECPSCPPHLVSLGTASAHGLTSHGADQQASRGGLVGHHALSLPCSAGPMETSSRMILSPIEREYNMYYSDSRSHSSTVSLHSSPRQRNRQHRRGPEITRSFANGARSPLRNEGRSF